MSDRTRKMYLVTCPDRGALPRGGSIPTAATLDLMSYHLFGRPCITYDRDGDGGQIVSVDGTDTDAASMTRAVKSYCASIGWHAVVYNPPGGMPDDPPSE